MVTWIVTDDQPFIVVECPEFQDLLNYCNSTVCLPSADTIKNDILKLFKEYRKKIQIILQVSNKIFKKFV